MSYTRRAVIRDAAVLSLASVGGFSPFLTGCRGSHFADGIRIFFEGAWLFCAHPTDPSQMLAMTLNPTLCVAPLQKCQQAAPKPDPTSMMHIFPFGVWDDQPKWDERHQDTQLAVTPCVKNSSGPICSMPTPHRIYILGHWPQPRRDVDALFLDADTTSRFIYCPNCGDPATTVIWSTPELRVISLPLPNRIIPAGFRKYAEIVDSKKRLNKHGDSPDTRGVATTHIFDYPGARSMLFVPHGGDAVELDHGSDFHSDFHFHTVPKCPSPPVCHDVMMFAALSGLLGLSYDIVLDPDYCEQDPNQILKGASVPGSVSDGELEMNSGKVEGPCQGKSGMTVTSTNLATCGSPGFGAGSGHGPQSS